MWVIEAGKIGGYDAIGVEKIFRVIEACRIGLIASINIESMERRIIVVMLQDAMNLRKHVMRQAEIESADVMRLVFRLLLRLS